MAQIGKENALTSEGDSSLHSLHKSCPTERKIFHIDKFS